MAIITSLMDIDVYKLTMLYYIWAKHPDVSIQSSFINRHDQVKLGDKLNLHQLRSDLDSTARLRFTQSELEFIASMKRATGEPLFPADFVDFLSSLRLSPYHLGVKDGQLNLGSTSLWTDATLWETIFLSTVNERYAANQVKESGQTLDQVWLEGKRRLEAKVTFLKAHPEIKFVDFGTRRRFSMAWHEYVIVRLKEAFADSGQFLGTSNLYFARKYDLPWIGTQAHELFMVEAALSANDLDLFESQASVLASWQQLYGHNLLTALTDTFGSDAFFDIFAPFAADWNVRQDSGDPFEFGDKVIAFYQSLGIDPLTKTIVFSDGLTVEMMLRLVNYFSGRIKVVFGWGTNLTNDLGFDAISIVAKVTAAGYSLTLLRPTVKLSDTTGKETGPRSYVDYYHRVFHPDQVSLKIVY